VVKQDGSALEYADKNLKADREVVLKAVKQDESVIEYAGEDIRSDKIFMKKHITDKSILKKFLIDKKNPKHVYGISISGEGGKQIASEIPKATYEYFCKDNELLIDHICLGEEVPDEFHIGDWYDCSDTYETGDCYELGCCTMSIDGNGESHDININEKELKKLGVKLIREKQTIEELVKPGEIKYFLSGIEEQNGSMHYELEIEGSFDPKKLSLTIRHFQSREMITWLEYDGQSIVNGSGDYEHEYVFEVIKVDKTRALKKQKAKKRSAKKAR